METAASGMKRALGVLGLAVLLVFAHSVNTVAAPVCATCHPGETARFLKSAMGNSLTVPAPLPAGKVTHPRSQGEITIEQRDRKMIHRLSEGGLTAEYPIQYQVGGALMGRTYLVQIRDSLFESPASWFNRSGWDVSPGYQSMALIDFDRPMEETCLFCHSGNARFADADGGRVAEPHLSAITCERCHGTTEAHVKSPSRKNIINPARLTGPARDSVCEQCHLEGATRTLNPGKRWSDFQAGEPTEHTFATYLLSGTNAQDVIAVSHAEQLAESMCALKSGGKLWCGNCHDPHGAVQDRPAQVRAICRSCHAQLSEAAHPAKPSECTSCHMPRREMTDIAHAAITDHRILRRPDAVTPVQESGAPRLAAWRQPAEQVRERDLGLAEILVGFSRNLPGLSADGVRLLRQMKEEEQANDPAVLSDLEGVDLQQDPVEAVRIGRRAAELQPKSAKVAMNLGIVLKRQGDYTSAEQELNRAISLDPMLKQAYMELAMMYASQRRMPEVSATFDRYLQENPQDILFRLQKARLRTAAR